MSKFWSNVVLATLCIIGATGLILFVILVGNSVIFTTTAFYESCTELTHGMAKEQVEDLMSGYLADNHYHIDIGGSGEYGGSRPLIFDESLTITLWEEPWYKFDQHPWACKIYFQNDLLVDVDVIFD